MGVCDYSCFFHGGEGEQCLCMHEDCCYEVEDVNNPDCEKDDLDCTDELLSEATTSTHHTGEAGSWKAYLLMFGIPGSKDIKNTESILDLIRENKDIERDLTEDEYSWDAWNFESYAGYDRYLTEKKGMTGNTPCSMWKPKHIDSSKETWALNVCPLCASLFLPELNLPQPQGLCSEYLRSIAEKHQIEIKTRSKAELVLAIREHFQFLL